MNTVTTWVNVTPQKPTRILSEDYKKNKIFSLFLYNTSYCAKTTFFLQILLRSVKKFVLSASFSYKQEHSFKINLTYFL